MKTFVRYVLATLAVTLAACSPKGGIGGFWKDADISSLKSDFDGAKEHFTEFAELTLKAPSEEAGKALDVLFDRLAADETAYYVYEEWCEGAFYNILSPYRNAVLFEHIAARVEADGIMADESARIQALRRYNSLNLKGQPITLPEDLTLPGGEPLEYPSGEEVTVLVINPSCRSCLPALRALAGAPGRHIAICFGTREVPSVPGWDYCHTADIRRFFDTEAAPFWFAADAGGTVTIPCSPVE